MKIAVLGATGAVGRTMLRVLEERAFPVDELVLLASERSAGTRMSCMGREWVVQAVSADAFEGCDFALFSAGAARSRQWAPIAAQHGAIVIDNSSGWRMDPDVPLVVPEVNARRALNPPRGIIANPNCATIQLVVALEALRRAAGLERVVVTTLQSVSGAGNKGISTLDQELAGTRAEQTPFVARIAHNVIPFIGPRGADGWNEEEEKIRAETRKILELPDLPVAATCVRVPVRVGHSISATVQTSRMLSRDRALAAMRDMTGIAEVNERDPLPIEAAGTDHVFVGHVREDHDVANTLHLWIVADNLRKGAATNAVQIAEAIIATRAATPGARRHA
ncbi:MAG TPA: aspartate-semialdehyde dehydrogenase [Longimicrobiales bacterium]